MLEFIWTITVRRPSGLAGRSDHAGRRLQRASQRPVGDWVLHLFGLESEYYLVTAFLGALLILWLARVLGRKGS